MDSYERYADDVWTSRQAMMVIRQHGASFAEFENDCGTKTHYIPAIILRWLGY